MNKLILVIIIIMLTSCSKEIKPSDFSLDSQIVYEKVLTKKDDFGGGICTVAYLQDSLIIFTDLFVQKILKLNTNTNQIKQIGQNGKGPGEYDFPIEIRKTSANSFAFTDAQNSSVIKEFDKEGNEVNLYRHTAGPLNNFSIDENYIALSPMHGNQISFANTSDNFYTGLFPYRKDLEKMMRASGGGIFIIDKIIYQMNLLEPIIHCYDILLKREFIIDLTEIQNLISFKKNLQIDAFSSINKKEVFDKLKELNQISDFHKLSVRDKNYFLINISHPPINDQIKYSCFITTLEGKILRYYDKSYSIRNVQENLIITCDKIKNEDWDDIHLKIFKMDF